MRISTSTAQADGLSDADMATLLAKYDTDGDGQINYEEFVKMMMSK